MINIMKKAREKYIRKYGVDPDNPKVVIINGIPLPKEYVNKLIKEGKIKPKSTEDTKQITILGGPSTGPHAINGKIYVLYSNR